MILSLYCYLSHFIFCILEVILKTDILFYDTIRSVGYFQGFYFIFWKLSQLYSRHFVRSEVSFRTGNINLLEVSTEDCL